MRRYLFISFVAAGVLAGCGANKNPGYAYMPDMQYSRAYETYAPTDNLNKEGVHFTGLPVRGTIARGEDYSMEMNLPFDSAGYAQSAFVKNPLDTVQIDLKEAERLYLVNCGICHGDKLDGNGPLFKGGDGPYTAAPKNFMDADMKALPPGTMFFSVTHGKGQMGSYASQLTPRQRWSVIKFIKTKQGVTEGAGSSDSTTATTPATTVDSTSTAAK